VLGTHSDRRVNGMLTVRAFAKDGAKRDTPTGRGQPLCQTATMEGLGTCIVLTDHLWSGQLSQTILVADRAWLHQLLGVHRGHVRGGAIIGGG